MNNTVPDNLDQVKKLEGFVRHILKDKRKQKFWTWMSYLEKLNRRMPVWQALSQSCEY